MQSDPVLLRPAFLFGPFLLVFCLSCAQALCSRVPRVMQNLSICTAVPVQSCAHGSFRKSNAIMQKGLESRSRIHQQSKSLLHLSNHVCQIASVASPPLSRKDGKQVKDDYENLKAEAKVLNQIIERLQGLEGSNSELQNEAERLKYVP